MAFRKGGSEGGVKYKSQPYRLGVNHGRSTITNTAEQENVNFSLTHTGIGEKHKRVQLLVYLRCSFF